MCGNHVVRNSFACAKQECHTAREKRACKRAWKAWAKDFVSREHGALFQRAELSTGNQKSFSMLMKRVSLIGTVRCAAFA